MVKVNAIDANKAEVQRLYKEYSALAPDFGFKKYNRCGQMMLKLGDCKLTYHWYSRYSVEVRCLPGRAGECESFYFDFDAVAFMCHPLTFVRNIKGNEGFKFVFTEKDVLDGDRVVPSKSLQCLEMGRYRLFAEEKGSDVTLKVVWMDGKRKVTRKFEDPATAVAFIKLSVQEETPVVAPKAKKKRSSKKAK